MLDLLNCVLEFSLRKFQIQVVPLSWNVNFFSLFSDLEDLKTLNGKCFQICTHSLCYAFIRDSSGWQTCFAEGHTVNILGFVDPMVYVTASELCFSSGKVTTDNP